MPFFQRNEHTVSDVLISLSCLASANAVILMTLGSTLRLFAGGYVLMKRKRNSRQPGA
jgi:hypothetical protein